MTEAQLPAPTVTPVSDSPLSSWTGAGAFDAQAQELVEAGAVLHCPHLSFAIEPHELRLFDPSLSDKKRKSIYLRGTSNVVHGTSASGETRDALSTMLQRYREKTLALVTGLFPSYRVILRPASTSFRPRPTGVGRASLSWRKDDTRLHVDAFPSNPTNGVRILRVFTNVGSEPRIWRVGEDFESMARHFLPLAPEYSAWRAKLLAYLGITKRKRSPYDHIMLHLHDLAKADRKYQSNSPQARVEFQPGATWICFSDQVMHAAMAGQYMLEQTIHVPLDALEFPALAPLAVLERLTTSVLIG